jgi:Icc protein
MTPGTLRLLHLTDLHLFEDVAGEIYGVRTDDTFRATLARALETAPGPIELILVTGDIAEDGRTATYRRFRTEILAAGLPVMCIPGNHEDREALGAVLSAPPLQLGGARRLGGWHVVMLDSHLPGRDEGELGEPELDLLDRELAAAGDAHVLVCVHHQPVPVGSAWLDAYGLRNPGAFLSRIEGRPNVRAVLFGHVHQASDRMHRGIRMMSTPSTCAQFTPNTQTCVMDLAPPGFRWLELLPDGSLRTEVVWLEELRRSERPPDSRQEA